MLNALARDLQKLAAKIVEGEPFDSNGIKDVWIDQDEVNLIMTAARELMNIFRKEEYIRTMEEIEKYKKEKGEIET